MNEIKIRPLRAEEIEVRVSQVTGNGCQLLLYKDARCDKRILDEIFGIFGWRNSYAEIGGRLYCKVGIYDKETDSWIEKSDCGVESSTEKEKGQASDAFKRACFSWGIGRELYTKIFIWLKVDTVQNRRTNRYELADRYQKWHVSHLLVDEKNEKITELKISDQNNKEVFSFPKGAWSESPKVTPAKPHNLENTRPCPIHKTMMRKFPGKQGRPDFYAHKLEDGSWCHGTQIIKQNGDTIQ